MSFNTEQHCNMIILKSHNSLISLQIFKYPDKARALHSFPTAIFCPQLYTEGSIFRAQHCIIIDPENSVVHCFIYHIDMELKACQLQFLPSAALQRRIILVLLTVSIVWVQSQRRTSEAWCSLHSVPQPVCRFQIIIISLSIVSYA